MSPALGKIKTNLGSNKFSLSVFNDSKKAIINTSDVVTPVWTGDLHHSIVSSPNIFRDNGFLAMEFGARGGLNPELHSDPGNYAKIKESEYGYFNTIFNVAEKEFLRMSEVSFGKLLNGK